MSHNRLVRNSGGADEIVGATEASGGGFAPSLLYRVARWYYDDRLSQQEIAQRLLTHRSTVSRLLQAARDKGIVRIDLVPPPELAPLSEQLTTGLDLRKVVVVDDTAARGASSARVVEALVEPALRELDELSLGPDSTLGVSWGSAVWRIASTAGGVDLRGASVVPILGGMNEVEPQFQTNEIVRSLAANSNGRVNFLHLPANLAPEVRADLLRDPEIRSRLRMWDHLDAAIVGIGSTQVSVDAWPKLERHNREQLSAAVGDIAARYFTIDGDPVVPPGDETLVGITREQLARVGTVLAVAAGPTKAAPIIGAARTGLIDVLVTDASTAVAVTDLLSR